MSLTTNISEEEQQLLVLNTGEDGIIIEGNFLPYVENWVPLFSTIIEVRSWSTYYQHLFEKWKLYKVVNNFLGLILISERKISYYPESTTN